MAARRAVVGRSFPARIALGSRGVRGCCSGLGRAGSGTGVGAEAERDYSPCNDPKLSGLLLSLHPSPTLPSPALPWLSRAKVNPAPGVSAAPPAAAGAGGRRELGSCWIRSRPCRRRWRLPGAAVEHPRSTVPAFSRRDDGRMERGGEGKATGSCSPFPGNPGARSRIAWGGGWDEPARGREIAAPEGKRVPGSSRGAFCSPHPAGIIPHIPAPTSRTPPGLREPFPAREGHGGHPPSPSPPSAPSQPPQPGPSTRHELPGK